MLRCSVIPQRAGRPYNRASTQLKNVSKLAPNPSFRPCQPRLNPTLLQERLSIASVLMTIDSVEMSVVARGTE